MISEETIAAWRKIEKVDRYMTLLWITSIVLNAGAGVSSYRSGTLTTLAVSAFFTGFSVAAFFATRLTRRSFEGQRAVIIAYDAALDQAGEAYEMMARHIGAPPIAPDPNRWHGETKH